MKVIRFAIAAAAMALASCAPRANEDIRPMLVANLCTAEANLAGVVMAKRQAGEPQSEIMTAATRNLRPEAEAIAKRIVTAAYAYPRTADVTGAVDRFKREQTAQCFRTTH